MDSGSSGSMQSSSGGGGGGGGGGDEAESISSFFNHHHPSSHFGGSISNPQPSSLLSHQQATFFDLQSQNLDTFPQSLATPSNANLQYNNEMVWPRGLRSEATNYVNFGNITASSSSLSLSSSSTQSLLGAHGINQAPLASSSSMPPLQSSGEGTAVEVKPNVVKNPKKRTRASRRAPTTILTTDTNNFRQMVQEFTGIPAAPFARGSPFSRGLDLFSNTGGAAMRTGQLDALGSLYPLRPSPQKAQLSPFIASSSSPQSLFNSSMINAIGPNSTNNTSTTTAIPTTTISGTSNAINSTTHNFSIPSNLSLPNLQNQLLNFQPLLQQPTLSQSLKLNPMRNEHFFSTSSDEIGMTHQQVNANLGGFSSQGGSEARQVRNDDDDDDHNRPRWRDEHVGSFDGHAQNAATNFKLNSSSSSEFYPEKVLENASSGGTNFRNYN